VGDPINESTLPVSAANKNALRKLLENPDDVTRHFQPFYRDLINPNIDVFVDMHSWNKFEAGEISKEWDGNRIYFISMLNPVALSNCTLIGANIEHSLIFNWFTQYHNVEFVEHEAIIRELRFSKHAPATGNRLRIAYLLKDRGHSKYLMNQTNDDGIKRGESYDLDVIRHFKDEKFLYAANNDYQGLLLKHENAEPMPTMSHGLNKYDEETNIYFGPALNRQPQHQKMLNHLGLDNHTIKSSTLHEASYQGLMRTALRNPDSKVTVNCVVPEYETAAQLVKIFDCTTEIKYIGDDKYKKVQPFTSAQRKKRSKFFKKTESLLRANHSNHELVGDCNHIKDTYVLHRKGNNSLIENTKEKCTHIGASSDLITELIRETGNLRDAISRANGCGSSEASNCQSGQGYITLHGDIYEKDDADFFVVPVDLQELIKSLREDAATVIDNKDELYLINPTTFDNTNHEGHRKLDNFEQSSMMVLDFDGGDLSIEDFERIFWTDAGKGKRSFVICNTFSRCEDQPNRFRVFMFYKHPVYSLGLHRAIYDSIVGRLKANGFTEKSAELDSNCRHGNQSFYVPCTNRRYQEQAYFKQYGTKTRDVERYAIDPELYAKTAMPTVEKIQLVDVDRNSIVVADSMDEGDDIEQILDSVRILPHGRHKPYFHAGLRLRSMGLSDHELEYHLTVLEADIGKQQYGWARDAMKSLRSSSGSVH